MSEINIHEPRIEANAVFHPQYTRATVHVIQDYNTHQMEIRASIGTAPDETTIIVYPYTRYAFGYWNKGTARKVAATMKRELTQWIKANGIKLSQAIETTERFC